MMALDSIKQIFFFVLSLQHLCFALPSKKIILTGENLTISDLVLISNEHCIVEIEQSVLQKVAKSHNVLLKMAQENKPVYGLNRGVGLNKDKVIFNADVLDGYSKSVSEDFNRNILFSHSVGMPPELSSCVIFPTMLIRLNTLLSGCAGAHPDVIQVLTQFINKRIQPIVLARGSIGETDIPILAHIGLAMMGEGEVIYENKRISAQAALKQCGIEALKPYAKDTLSIISSNAYSAAMAALLINEIEEFLEKADLIFALSLEALNGNISPFLWNVQSLRPFKGQCETAKNVNNALIGSFLWLQNGARALQDPLSFRCMSQVHGAARDILKYLKEKIGLQINSSDDNPAVILRSKNETSDLSEQERCYYLNDESAAVIPNGNFDPINWIIELESLMIAVNHIAQISVQRMLKLSDSRFSKLSRFLAPHNQAMGFDALQYSFVALQAEMRALLVPCSLDVVSVSDAIEDHATNAAFGVRRLRLAVEILWELFGLELMHAAQAIDLRNKDENKCILGKYTQQLHLRYREKVAFLDQDRPLFNDIVASKEFMKTYTF